MYTVQRKYMHVYACTTRTTIQCNKTHPMVHKEHSQPWPKSLSLGLNQLMSFFFFFFQKWGYSGFAL